MSTERVLDNNINKTDTNFWEKIKTNIKGKNINNKLLQTWFEPIKLLTIENSDAGIKKFFFGVPSKLHKYWIDENLFENICSEISLNFKNPFEVNIVVVENHKNEQDIKNDTISFEKSKTLAKIKEKPLYTEIQKANKDCLNPSYDFSSFVVGKNNEFAHAACFYVAQTPASEGYNPLFISGPVGMGKTHLINAVGNSLIDSKPNLRISYVSAERFFNECISSIRRNEMDKFRKKYRDKVDILLVDDIQFLGRGEAVQEEFFHTMDDLLQQKKQIIVASDRLPRDILGIEDRIKSRLEWGLIAYIQMPDLETRIAILKYKAEQLNLKISEEIINYISKISKRSIRELEGNLKTVKMFSELQGLNINLELTKKVLGRQEDQKTISMEEIQKIVSSFYNVKISDLKGKSRTKLILKARQIAMYLTKINLDKSLIDIGQSFGGKDHTTVINAIRKTEANLQHDKDLYKEIEDLTLQIQKITGV